MSFSKHFLVGTKMYNSIKIQITFILAQINYFWTSCLSGLTEIIHHYCLTFFLADNFLKSSLACCFILGKGQSGCLLFNLRNLSVKKLNTPGNGLLGISSGYCKKKMNYSLITFPVKVSKTYVSITQSLLQSQILLPATNKLSFNVTKQDH